MVHNFYLIRHGQKQVEYGDPALTSHGQEQAAATGQYFASIPLHGIFASPLLRTQQTAHAIASATQLTVELEPRLRERANWDGSNTFEDFLQMWRQASKDRDAKPLVGVSSRQAGQRVHWLVYDIVQANVSAQHQLQEQKQPQLHKQPSAYNYVLVSHGGTITDFLRNIFSDQELLQRYYKTTTNIVNTQIPECSVTQVQFRLEQQHQGSFDESQLVPQVLAPRSFDLVQVGSTLHLTKIQSKK